MTRAKKQTRRRPFPAAPERDTVSVRTGGAVHYTRTECSPTRTQPVAALEGLALVGRTASAANAVVDINGLDVVDKIKGVETANAGPHENVPVQDVVIKSIKRAN